MKFSRYQVLASRTEKPLDFDWRLLHHQMGLTTEVGELTDIIKRHTIYGQRITTAEMKHIEEELGDILWYVAGMANAIHADLDAIATANIDKLQRRYPGKFTNEDALARADKAGEE